MINDSIVAVLTMLLEIHHPGQEPMGESGDEEEFDVQSAGTMSADTVALTPHPPKSTKRVKRVTKKVENDDSENDDEAESDEKAESVDSIDSDEADSKKCRSRDSAPDLRTAYWQVVHEAQLRLKRENPDMSPRDVLKAAREEQFGCNWCGLKKPFHLTSHYSINCFSECHIVWIWSLTCVALFMLSFISVSGGRIILPESLP